MLARRAALAALGSLLIATSAQAGGLPSLQSYEWMPNGSSAGPQLVILVKLDVTGKLAVQCGKTWIFTYFGGGAVDPIVQAPSTGAISGRETYPMHSVGIGPSYVSASTDYYLVKEAGPLVMTLNAQPSQWPARGPAGASGALHLTLYAPGSKVPGVKVETASSHKKRKKPKPKTVVVASCTVQFSATNYYAGA